jgi:CRISPR-associated protein Cmr4
MRIMSDSAKTGDLRRTYWIHALSSLHVGAGRGVGYIDLPVTREKTTNWPFVPGSAVKGVLADHFGAGEEARKGKAAENRRFRTAFGLAGDSDANAGALVFTDARLVCLPVRSFFGTFAWVTSPFALTRLLRDALSSEEMTVPSVSGQGEALLPPGSKLLDVGRKNLYLEDLDFAVKEDPSAKKWAEYIAEELFQGETGEQKKSAGADWKNLFLERFVILHDDAFTFLCETGTEVAARVRIQDDKKIVANGALWYEESLPAETILAGTVWCDRLFGKTKGSNGEGPENEREETPEEERRELLEHFCSGTIRMQLGGKATVGRGQVRCLFSGR